jgi:hypothetical protein
MNNTTPLKQIVTETCTLGKLIKQSTKLMALTKLLQTTLADELSLHCNVAKYSKGTLVLAVENASWATQLRYNSAQLLEALKKTAEFNKLTTIKFFVQTKIPIKDKEAKKIVRSKTDLEQARLLRKNAEAAAKTKSKKQ